MKNSVKTDRMKETDRGAAKQHKTVCKRKAKVQKCVHVQHGIDKLCR